MTENKRKSNLHSRTNEGCYIVERVVCFSICAKFVM